MRIFFYSFNKNLASNPLNYFNFFNEKLGANRIDSNDNLTLNPNTTEGYTEDAQSKNKDYLSTFITKHVLLQKELSCLNTDLDTIKEKFLQSQDKHLSLVLEGILKYYHRNFTKLYILIQCIINENCLSQEEIEGNSKVANVIVSNLIKDFSKQVAEGDNFQKKDIEDTINYLISLTLEIKEVEINPLASYQYTSGYLIVDMLLKKGARVIPEDFSKNINSVIYLKRPKPVDRDFLKNSFVDNASKDTTPLVNNFSRHINSAFSCVERGENSNYSNSIAR